MKRTIFSVFLSLWLAFAYAQNVGTISIGVVVPDQQDEIPEEAFRLLATRMQAITASQGISSDMNGTFVMYPVVNITDKQLVEGGLKRFQLVEIELSLFIRQLATKAEFGTCTKSLKGQGRNMTEAVRNAFAQINPKDNVYSRFLSEAKTKITDYYTANRSTMIEKARSLASMQSYEEALALLAAYPDALPGSAEVRQVSIDIYKKYQNSICSQLLSKAQEAIAAQDYETALSVLSQIDSESNCHADAVQLTRQIGSNIKEQQKVEEELTRQAEQREQDLEKQRIQAIRDIAVAYYQNQPQISYSAIVY
ncbi:MAG: hypothetical protein LUC45_08170 [Paraprevotella sp.]|nr:hypothetical protein [Paraprevotella sp.]